MGHFRPASRIKPSAGHRSPGGFVAPKSLRLAATRMACGRREVPGRSRNIIQKRSGADLTASQMSDEADLGNQKCCVYRKEGGSEINDDQCRIAGHRRVARIAMISRTPAGPAPQWPSASRSPKLVMALIGGAAAARIARDRRTYERLIVIAIVLAAVAGLARENQARSQERMAAWLKRTLGA